MRHPFAQKPCLKQERDEKKRQPSERTTTTITTLTRTLALTRDPAHLCSPPTPSSSRVPYTRDRPPNTSEFSLTHCAIAGVSKRPGRLTSSTTSTCGDSRRKPRGKIRPPPSSRSARRKTTWLRGLAGEGREGKGGRTSSRRRRRRTFPSTRSVRIGSRRGAGAGRRWNSCCCCVAATVVCSNCGWFWSVLGVSRDFGRSVRLVLFCF